MIPFVGGHTKEMLSLLSGLGPQYRPRCYVIAKTDTMSQQKVEMFEKQRQTVEGIKSAEVSHKCILINFLNKYYFFIYT